MDEELSIRLIERDWEAFHRQARLLALGEPVRSGTRIDLPVVPAGSDDRFVAVLLCDGYDAVAPLLDFADPDHPESLGAAFWPRMQAAPMNSVPLGGRTVPIVCTPGTRGYHAHPSHASESYRRETWRLPAVATVLHRLLRTMGPYVGRGL